MMATCLLNSTHLLRFTHLRGFTHLLTHLRNNSQVQSFTCSVKKKFICCLKRFNLKTIAYISVGGAAVGTYMLESPYISEILLRKRINKSQCSFPEPSMVIERTNLQKDLTKFLDLDRYQPNPVTRIVCGPRGSGKTAAVLKVLKGKKHVVYVHIRDGDDTDLAKQIHRALSVYVPKETDPTCLLETVLQRTSRWYNKIPFSKQQDPGDEISQPILVVDFNPRVDIENFENMLLLLKSWGSDSGWIKPIVILTNTLGLRRPRLELRTEFFKIEDLKGKECDSYREQLCNMINSKNNQCKSEISKILPPDRWNRFLYLNTLAQSNISSLKELEAAATQLEKEQREIYENALNDFTMKVKDKEKEKGKDKEGKDKGQQHVFCRLMKGEKVYLKEFCDEYGLPEKDIIEILLAIRPRPFYIHPQTREVYIGSSFMMPALERMCPPESTST